MNTSNFMIQHLNQLKTEIIQDLSDSDKVLQLTKYHCLPIPEWKPLKKHADSGLRIACIVEERLYQGLRFEAEIFPLTPNNWHDILAYAKPDILLIESAWTTATGHWHMEQCTPSEGYQELLKIISTAQKYSIPTVFWFTKSHFYHEHYKNFSKNFDYVFCADPIEIDLLSREKIQAELLLPCVQPALYNPFRLYDHHEALNINLLYDGWADLDRLGQKLDVLKDFFGFDIRIIESRYQIFHSRKKLLPEYEKFILGCSTSRQRLNLLRYAKSYLTLDKTLSSKVTQQWMTLEAIACYLPVMHYGKFDSDDIRKGIAQNYMEKNDILVELTRFREDDLYRKRIAHKGWRTVFQQHTFAHRVKAIYKKINIDCKLELSPKVSIITPTYREDMLSQCLDNFKQQAYPNKELIIVFNGNKPPSPQEFGLDIARQDVKLTHVPSDLFAATCLNHGHAYATGQYCFRMDDDDYYGPNYIMDVMLQATCIDADVFGKAPVPIFFENDKTLYSRNRGVSRSVISEKALSQDMLWVGGNSIAAKYEIFKEIKYCDSSFGAADTRFIYNLPKNKFTYATMDEFNLVANRRGDKSTHTWKIDDNSIKMTSTLIGNNYKEFWI
ncbi:glycosyltransferase [Candidatus Venteria ishoeyi]|nr:glycosyltransferase [Candidatus Venteria ishoeyi]